MKKIIFSIIIILSLFTILDVNAENGTVRTKEGKGINLRDKPTTKSEILATISDGTNFYISNLNAGTGNGCEGAWYHIYYANKYGYVCSDYVIVTSDAPTSFTYDRPWNTPKKSIIGGAKFISEGYISKGQHTSYLTKFNVNSKSYYANFSHQYMANLAAPASKSSSNYNSLTANGLLNSAFNFVIPVYLNMPSTTYNGTINTFRNTTDHIQDVNFENSISGFPDDYKPYLRYLHSIYPLWTFSPLITNHDFNDSVSKQKYVSSIEISTGRCEQNPYKQTETDWCIATNETTAFYLDPRNFLSERYIFMFENLAYDDLYTEAVVQSVLKNTFMSGFSLIDNQSYSSIFIEAGKIANISPLYLASFARTEVGVNGGLATSGDQFEYGGYTYSGLYNFFNIGAYSSEQNPTKAGLVYANGGKGINNGLDSPTTNLLRKLGLNSIGAYVRGYKLGTTIGSIKDTAGSDSKVIIKNKSGNEKNNNEIIATGDYIYISHNNEEKTFIYVMKGDINGDGLINSADLLSIRQHLLGINKLTGANLSSASLTNNSEINSADLLKMRQHLLGISLINQ